jgi:uncharacterized protein (TIGR01777 family)
MNIAILGYSGFLGTLTSKYFIDLGNTVLYISRNDIKYPDLLFEKIRNSDVVINFAGSSISKRWTNSYKKQIFESRVLTTRTLVECLNKVNNHKIYLINASAIGIYDDFNIHTETSLLFGNSFLSSVVKDWEHELLSISNSNITVSVIRLGIVIDKNGGYLKQLLAINNFRIIPYFGSKLSKFCFIDSFDFLCALTLIINERFSGIFNFSAPQVTSNFKIASYLSKFNKTSFVFHIPDFILKAIFGSGYFVFKGTPIAFSKRIVDLGFHFKYDSIEKSLNSKLL